ncbi:FAD-dependent oxidoreductase [Nocardia aurantiaca]|uniref:FAD-binding protein n=1 Tax=Nocardia aurantiaca TaxID=2675850 RepID=A0A6I3L6H1_9NOCA|nr:FAD-binding oxidoreductase [Nocardia aurantiaca]MTE16046.1 FAD-binding protein [Nocardia aurantiaca]
MRRVRSVSPTTAAGAGFSRGTFLCGALGIAMAGWGFTGMSDADPVADSSGPGAATPNWSMLERRIRGRVVDADDADYGMAKQVFNTRFDGETPIAVVQAADTDDVVAAMSFAAEHRLPVAARSGGHSYAGVSTASGAMIIDVRQLTGVSVDAGRAVVAPGHTLYEVYRELDRSGLTIPTGMCPDVGIAGLALGGGIGFESRAYGVTCDRLAGATLVLPDGTVTAVSETSRPELFWALRGGGPLFGVVTSLTFDTCPATSKDLVRLTFPGDRAARVIAGWSTWLRCADRSEWADVSVDADGDGNLDCWMQMVCPAGSGRRAAAALTDAIGMQPLSVDTQTLDHMDTITYLAGGGPTTPRASFTNGSDVVTDLTPDAIAYIIEALTAFSSAGGTGWVQINTLDGAIGDTAPTATAFPWRTHAALVEWGAYQPIPHDTALAWITAAHRRFAPVSAGAYVNYLEPGDPLSRYYAQNYPRLAALRRTIDPDNRIRTVLTA